MGVLAFFYGLVCYMIFLVTFLYAIGFVENLVVPTSLDALPRGPLARAVLIDVVLLGVFAVQHSVMARQGFKRAWTRIVPRPIERSTFVLFASLALVLLFWKWHPIGGTIWDVRNSTMRALLIAVSLAGWLIVLISTFLIDHFDLFGLRQTFLFMRGRTYAPVAFKTPGFYRFVRHPIYVGFIIAFWAAPTMTIAHLLFAVATTAYILIAIQLEERDLISFYGDGYRTYRKRVSMLIPTPSRKSEAP
jgi:methanethiol S-methyltransferase